MSQKTPKSQYQNLLETGALVPDSHQQDAINALEQLYHDICAYRASKPKSWLKWLQSDPEKPIQSLYLYGGVGRGKSMLMDLFYQTLPMARKRRVHFHEFMIEVHDYINASSQKDGDPQTKKSGRTLLGFAKSLAQKTRVLCFDEFHVTNIADAMILGRLFQSLFEQGVVVVATSNWAPEDLYKNGLQRERFEPFINLLKKRAKVVHLNSDKDYRTQKMMDANTYFYPLNAQTKTSVDDLYLMLTNHDDPYEDTLKVRGRELFVEACGAVAKFSFAQLCEQPLGAEDYLEIAKRFDTVFVLNVPKLTYDRRNEAKRFISLIDAFYEAKTKVIISAAAKEDSIYVGSDHQFEFERTISRLREMQSNEYLKKS